MSDEQVLLLVAAIIYADPNASITLEGAVKEAVKLWQLIQER